jgi:hypothetical protein
MEKDVAGKSGGVYLWIKTRKEQLWKAHCERGFLKKSTNKLYRKESDLLNLK